MGHQDVVNLLLENGASLMSRNDSGNSALHLASEAGHLCLVKYLVELKTDGLHSLNYDKETALHLAAENGRVYLVIYLAEKGCSVNAECVGGDTCLHVACENGHYTTVECLMKHGAEVNAMNSAGQTPLHIAACRGETKIVRLLFLHKTDFLLQDKEGITALMAASINGYHDTVLFIVQHGGNIEDTDGKGNTIAHFAVADENHDLLTFLSENHSHLLHVQNYYGETPLLQALREGINWIAQFVTEEPKGNRTALDDEVIKLTRVLKERYVPSGKAGKYIVEAARLGFLYLLQKCVESGDDTNVMDDNGES
jgi:ankyrin repeat protein